MAFEPTTPPDGIGRHKGVIMTISGTLATIAIILIWTVIRETLLEKYWKHRRGDHLAEFGNLYIVMGCFAVTFAILLIAFD
jgi:choline-glycine betaine transporter